LANLRNLFHREQHTRFIIVPHQRHDSGGLAQSAALRLTRIARQYRRVSPCGSQPMADEDEGWARLAKNLKAEIDPEPSRPIAATSPCPLNRANTAALLLR
jgi:hypothetical protein